MRLILVLIFMITMFSTYVIAKPNNSLNIYKHDNNQSCNNLYFIDNSSKVNLDELYNKRIYDYTFVVIIFFVIPGYIFYEQIKQ